MKQIELEVLFIQEYPSIYNKIMEVVDSNVDEASEVPKFKECLIYGDDIGVVYSYEDGSYIQFVSNNIKYVETNASTCDERESLLAHFNNAKMSIELILPVVEDAELCLYGQDLLKEIALFTEDLNNPLTKEQFSNSINVANATLLDRSADSFYGWLKQVTGFLKNKN